MRVIEIIKTIQGEGTRAGRPCHLIRLAGCNLRCRWCDTPHAQPVDGGRQMSVDQVLVAVAVDACKRALVTGGEPLVQHEATAGLCVDLLDRGFEVLLETNGSVDFSGLDGRVIRIVDVKCPSSGQEERNRLDLLDGLRDRDEIKFVLADEADYRWARALLAERRRHWRATVLFGAVAGALDPGELARWILRDDLDVRLNVQWHKRLGLP
jgi:7-carboxy-7-deazaguanine synthase